MSEKLRICIEAQNASLHSDDWRLERSLKTIDKAGER